MDTHGTVYVADRNNQTIREISPAGAVTTIAGTPALNGSYADGVGTDARFNSPAGVAVDRAGNIYVSEAGNATIPQSHPARSGDHHRRPGPKLRHQ